MTKNIWEVRLGDKIVATALDCSTAYDIAAMLSTKSPLGSFALVNRWFNSDGEICYEGGRFVDGHCTLSDSKIVPN